MDCLKLNYIILYHSRTCLFLDKPIEKLETSMNLCEIDEYTDNNSENCKSTLFAHQLEIRTSLNDDNSNVR